MSTNYIAPIWRMPENTNNVDDKLSNYSMDFQNGGSSGRHIGCGTDLFTGNTIPSISISVWIKTSANGVIMCKDIGTSSNRNFLFQIAGTQLYWQTSVDGTNFDNLIVSQATFDVIDSEWHHIVVTYNTGSSSGDGEKKIYIDGSEIADSPLATYGEIYNTLTTPIEIGRRGDNTRYFYDNMSQVCIFDYALSSSQVSYLYGLDNPMAITGGEPVAYWPLGDNGNPNSPGSFPNISTGTDSVFDFATGDALRITDSSIVPERFQNIGNNNSYSISFWMKSTYTGSGGSVWYANHTFTEIRTQTSSGTHVPFSIGMSSNTIRFGRTSNHTSSYNAYNSVANNLSDGQWHHVVCAINDDTLKMYIDNNLDSTRTFTSATGDCSVGDGTVFPLQNFQIGARTQNGGAMDGFANGDELTNFQFWDTELLAADVTTLYNNGQPLMTGTQPQESNLIGWYKMNQSANWEAITANTWQIPDNRSAYPQSFDFTKTSGEYINLGLDDWFNEYNNEITFSFWINKPNWSSTGFEGIISKFGSGGTTIQYRIAYPSSAGQLQFYLQGSATSGSGYSARTHTVTLTSAQQASEWLHIVWRHNANTGVSEAIFNGDYANAVSLTAIALNPYAQPQTTVLNVIGNVANGLQPFDGAISNYQRFNSYLDNVTVEALYNEGIPNTTAIAPANLEAWYKLDNTATFSTNWSIPDASGNGNTATSSGLTGQSLANNNVSTLNAKSQSMNTTSLVQSNLTRTQPYSNYSFHFDGTQYINIPDSDLLSFGNGTNDSPFSISAWIKKPLNANEAIISKFGNTGGTSGYEWLLWVVLTSPHRIRFAVYDNSNAVYQFREGNTTIDTGEWIHVVATYDGRGNPSGAAGNTANQGMKIYINGIEESSYTDNNGGNYVAMHNTPRVVQIGATNNSNQFDGEISNTAIFDKELTNQEVLKIYNNGVPQDLQTASSFSNNLVAWWPMDQRSSYYDGTNWVARDLENGNDGTGVNTGNVDDLVGNAPGSQASGVGSNFQISYLEGNMYNSDKNAYSINMADYADGVTNPANSGRSTDTP